MLNVVLHFLGKYYYFNYYNYIQAFFFAYYNIIIHLSEILEFINDVVTPPNFPASFCPRKGLEFPKYNRKTICI